MPTEKTPAAEHEHHEHEHHEDIVYPEAIPFIGLHVACLAVFATGVSKTSIILAVSLYFLRMFAITAGFHRYFSHKSFKTSRAFQFVLAALGQTSFQRGALWWAAKHRAHHRYSDTELDPHSPGQHGFFMAHVGWIFDRHKKEADLSVIPDLTRFSELVWLDKHHKIPAFALALICFLIDGWTGLVVGFLISTVVLFHCTFFINSLAHVVGRQRYVTGDDSRNNWWLALITLGEGWHNNHHFYQASTRQGFRWWEIDVTFYTLKMLSWVGLVWDLKAPPTEVVRGERPLPRPVVEKVAHQLAASFTPEAIGQSLRDAWAEYPSLGDLRQHLLEMRTSAETTLAQWSPAPWSAAQWSAAEHWPRLEALITKLEAASDQAAARIADIHMPELPSFEEVRTRANEMFATTPSVDDIVQRARQLIAEAVSAELIAAPDPATASA